MSAALACCASVGCSDDITEQLEFSIEGSNTAIHVDAAGVATNATKQGLSIDDAINVTIRANGAWKLVPVSGDNDWVIILPMEGDKDGIIRIGVWPNTSFDARVAEYAIMVNGKEYSTLLRIEQDAVEPYLTINGAEDGINVPGLGGSISIPIDTNLDDWTCSIDADWLTVTDDTDNKLILTASQNLTSDDRVATVTVKSARYPELNVSIECRQPTLAVLLNEDFSWLNYGLTAWEQTSGEKTMLQWTAAEKAMGWTSIVSGTNTSWQQPGYIYVFGRPGFVKLGATNYGGNIVSPAFSGIGVLGREKVDVDLSFHALGYIGGGSATTGIPGPLDANDLYVGLWGDGEIGSIDGTNEEFTFTTDELGTVTLPVVHYSLQYPNSSNAKELGANYDSWCDERSLYNLVIRNATENTRVVFFAGPFYNGLAGRGTETVTYMSFTLTKNKNINRVFIDNVKALIKTN
jgi:hypothetical protein